MNDIFYTSHTILSWQRKVQKNKAFNHLTNLKSKATKL